MCAEIGAQRGTGREGGDLPGGAARISLDNQHDGSRRNRRTTEAAYGYYIGLGVTAGTSGKE